MEIQLVQEAFTRWMHWATRWSPCLPSCCQICKETLLENAKALAFMEIAGHMILFAGFYSFYSYLWSFGVIQSELIIFVKATRQQYVWPFIENNSTFAPSVHIWLTTFTSKTFMVQKKSLHLLCLYLWQWDCPSKSHIQRTSNNVAGYW